MDEELIDQAATVKDQRGKTLPVLCILSWVSLGFATISLLLSVFNGPKSEEQLMEEKISLLSSVNDDTPDEVKLMYEDMIDSTQLVNEYHWTLAGINFVSILIGFFAVFLMWKLKKTGFYLYLAYSIIPLVVSSMIMDGMFLSIVLFFTGLFSLLFIILYAVQLKRMH